MSNGNKSEYGEMNPVEHQDVTPANFFRRFNLINSASGEEFKKFFKFFNSARKFEGKIFRFSLD